MNGWIAKPILRDHGQVARLLNVIDTSGAFIAGGYARWLISPNPSFKADDIDIFTGNTGTFHGVMEMMEKSFRASWNDSLIYQFYDNSDFDRITHYMSVIYPLEEEYSEGYGSTKVKGSQEDILNDFDLYLCEAVIKDKDTVLCSRQCWNDIDFNSITFKKLDKPRRALKRAFKYAKKGFGVDDLQLSSLITAIKEEQVIVHT